MNHPIAKIIGLFVFPVGFFALVLFAGLVMPNIQKTGHLHTFHLLIFSSWHMVFFIGGIIEFLLIYLIRERSHWILWSIYILVGTAMYLLAICYVFAYGHIDEHGITYSSMNNFLTKRTVSWQQVNDPVFLRLLYYDNRDRGYSNRIVLRIVDNSTEDMTILFDDDTASRETLLKVLHILKYNNKQIVTLSDKITIDKALSTPTTARFFKKISLLAPVNIRNRYDFVEHRYHESK